MRYNLVEFLILMGFYVAIVLNNLENERSLLLAACSPAVR